MNIDLQTAFKRANAVLNRTQLRLSTPELSLRIHYWGFMPQHYDNENHRHSFLEACYVMEGSGVYIEGEQHYELKPGTSFISRPGIWHQIKSETGMALCYVAFEPDISTCSSYYQQGYERLMKQASPLFSESNSLALRSLWTALVMMFIENNQFPPLAVQSTALSLMISFMSEQAVTAKINEQDAARNVSAALFRRAKLFIDDNLSEPLSLQTVAKHLHITPRHLTRLFAQHQQLSFVHYIQEQRVQMAVDLMLHTDKEIKDIAVLCGFDSVHYFTRVFTIKLGVSPAKFRRSQFSEGRSGALSFPTEYK